MTRKEVYEERKASGQCVDCPTFLTEGYTKARCPRCLELRRAYSKRKTANRQAKIVEHVVEQINSGDKFILDTRKTNRIVIRTFSRDRTVLRRISA